MPVSLADRLVLALDRHFDPARVAAAPGAGNGTAQTAGNGGGGVPVPAPVRRRSEDGAPPVVWLCAADASSGPALAGAARHLELRFPGHDFLVTPLSGQPGPGPQSEAIDSFLDQVRPVAAVLTCTPFRPVLTSRLAARGIPVLGAMLRLPQNHWMERRLARPLARRHLAGFRALLAEDGASRARLLRAGARPQLLSVGGVLSDPVAVPPANAAEQQSLTELMLGRPLWCAVALPLAEVGMIAEAHGLALRRSHRMLLVVVPDRIEDAPAMQERLAAAGLVAALRSDGDDPVEDFPVYIADLEGELGLWLRLAPVSFMGGTMRSGSRTRSPIEAAALGSAVLHGPGIGACSAAYGRLTAAGAARAVRDAAGLAAQIDILSAPDQAAEMAHAGWEVASAGDEAAEALAEALVPLLGPSPAPAPGAAGVAVAVPAAGPAGSPG